jgi:hypothetical protein
MHILLYLYYISVLATVLSFAVGVITNRATIGVMFIGLDGDILVKLFAYVFLLVMITFISFCPIINLFYLVSRSK